MMKTTIAAALALVVASGAAMAEFKDFTVNGDLVTKGQQEAVATEAISNNPNPHAAIANPQIEDQVRQMVIEYKVMSQYAKKEGLDKQQAVKDDIERMTDMVLMKHAVNEYVKKNPVTEKELKDEYQKESDRWGKTEYRVRHILVKTQDEAKQISERRLQHITGTAAGSKDWDTEQAQQDVCNDRNCAEPSSKHQARQQREQELQGIDIGSHRDADEGTDCNQGDKQGTQHHFAKFKFFHHNLS